MENKIDVSSPAVELIRHEENYFFGTFGVLLINKQLFCLTLEPRDEENANDISSIPAQQYMCKKYSSPRYPNTFQVMHVPNRTNVLFHAGNVSNNTMGCILLGRSVGTVNGKRGVLDSNATMKEFMEIMSPYASFTLTIKEVY